MKCLFFEPIKVFWSIVAQKKQNKTKSKKRFVGVTEKHLKTGILKHIWWEVIWKKLKFRMLSNTLKDWLCYLRNETMQPWKSSFWTCTKYRFYSIWESLRHLIYSAYWIFFNENYWSHLTWTVNAEGASAMAT